MALAALTQIAHALVHAQIPVSDDAVVVRFLGRFWRVNVVLEI